MIHWFCEHDKSNVACMKKIFFNNLKKCNKKYSKQFNDWIDISQNIYSTYQRRNDGRCWQKKIDGQTVIFDNQNVVSYNPYLSPMFNAHINVEICTDRRYYAGRYLSSCEAVWRILEFRTHEEIPAVNAFSIYLKGEQIVYFSSNILSQKLKLWKKNMQIKLMIYFYYKTIYLNDVSRFYIKFPVHFTWHFKIGAGNPINKNPRSPACIMWIRSWMKDSDYDSFWWLCRKQGFLSNCIELMMFDFQPIGSHASSGASRKMINIDITVLMTTFFMSSLINCDYCLSLTYLWMKSMIRESFEINIINIFSTILFVILNKKIAVFAIFKQFSSQLFFIFSS